MKDTAKHCLRSLLLGSLVLLASCATSHQKGTRLATGEKRPLPFADASLTHVAATLDTSAIQVADTQQTSQESLILEREGAMPGRNNDKATQSITPYPDNLLKSLPNRDAKVNVVLAFNAADISEVVAAFASPDLLNFSYLVDPSVKGAVTLSVETEMTASEAWDTFEHILWLSGAYASMNNGFLHILPFEKMPQERKLFSTEKQPNVSVEFIPVLHKKSGDIANLIKPFMTEGASATDIADTNTLVIVEAPANMDKIRELISRFDDKGEREWPCAAFAVTEVDADTMVTELNSLLPVLGYPVSTTAGTSGGAIKITALSRIGCLVVSAALPEVVDEVGKWIRALDRSDRLDQEEIYFYNVSETTVTRLADAMETFFNTEITVSSADSSSSSSSRKSSSSSSSSSSLNSSSSSSSSSSSRNTSSTRNNNRNNNSRNRNDNDEPKANLSLFETPVTVFADEESNRLTIKTTPRTWGLIQAFLKRHDVPSRQVSIRAIIGEVTLDKSTEFGVSYAASKLFKDGSWTGSGGYAGAGALGTLFNGTDDAIKTAVGAWDSAGLGLVVQRAKDPLALITAVAGEGRTKILSEPQLVVVSGQEAKFQAGEEIAVPTQSTSYTSSSGNTSTNYEYKDIGVIMTVTPSITAGNRVRLEIEQEVTAQQSSSTNTNNTNAPNFTKKDISTVMTVQDNSTILMGGMVQNRETVTKRGIPFLRDIPYLGALFGYDSRQNVRTEVLVLITVNVIDNNNFQDELIRRYKDSLEEIAKRQQEEHY